MDVEIFHSSIVAGYQRRLIEYLFTNVLFSRLKDMFALSGKVLEWFRSYLEQRSQRVSVHGILSDIQFLLSDVPQGSVLGTLVFTMYTRPLGIIPQLYGVKYHLYADDKHLYISLDADNELNFSSFWKNLKQMYC